MKSKIDQRKNIIISLKPAFGERKKGIDKRINFLGLMSSINLIFFLFSGGVICASIISEQLGYEFFKWQKMGLLTLLSLSFALTLPNEIYELKLLRHLKNINSKSDFNGIDKLNIELKSIIDYLNNRLKSNWMILVLIIVIFIMGIWQMGFDNNNPYWDYMKTPVVIVYGIILFRFAITNKKLTKNISETEKIL